MMSLRKISAIATAAFGALILTSCSGFGDVVFSESRSISPECWSPDQIIEFTPIGRDSTSLAGARYRLDLGVRHNDSFPYKELRLEVQYEAFYTPARTDTITIPLCDDRGRWLGSGSHLLYEVNNTLEQSFVAPDGLTVSITPLHSDNCISGVTDVTLTMTRLTTEQ